MSDLTATALESLRAELGEERAEVMAERERLRCGIPALRTAAADTKAYLETLVERTNLLGKEPLSPIISRFIENARIAARTAEGAHRLAVNALENARDRLATLLEAEAQLKILVVGQWPAPAIVRRPAPPALSLAPLEPHVDAA